MGFVVKKTTKYSWLDVVCPPFCMGCGRLGSIICECCKKDMKRICKLKEKWWLDKDCSVKSVSAIKKDDSNPTNDANEYCDWNGLWAVGERKGLLDELIKRYKYDSSRNISGVMAGLIADVIPFLDEKVVIVPLPTIRKHIRERGFDHTLVLAKKLARMRGWKYEIVLARKGKAVQVGANMEQRKVQAREAYEVVGKIDEKKSYVLLDDVLTTGASMCAGLELMRRAGAKKVYGAVMGVSFNDD